MKTYSINTNTLSVNPNPSTPYTLTGANGICTASTTVTVNVTPTPTVIITGNQAICSAQSTTLTGSAAGTYTWNPGAISTNTISISPGTNTNYTLTEANGICTASAVATVSVTTTPTIGISGAQTICLGGNTILTGAGATTYTWSANAGNAATNTVSVNPNVNTTYTVTGTNGSCTTAATVAVNVIIPATPDICMVTVDSATLYKNNIVYWNKTLYTHVDSFIVCRETSTNIYNRIGAVSKDSLSRFIDTARNVGGPNGGHPDYGAYKYKIQIRDSCGNYSTMSPYHNTVFFQDQHNGNFNWNLYTIESQSVTPVGNFYLMRDDNNTNNYLVIGSVSGSQTSTSDPAYATYQAAGNWRVDATGFNCTPTLRYSNNSTQTAVVKSRSNVRNNRGFGINPITNNNQIKIYPNPANNELIVLLSENCNDCKIEILNVLGETIKNIFATNNESKTSVADLQNGVYFVKVNSNGNSFLQKLIVQH